MRNALILLVVVALVILTVGALNNGTSFTIDYVAGSVSAVSLLWVSAVIAALVVVAGLAASWFALSAATGARRKLEAELQTTYERLRKAEALAARPAPAAAAAQEPPTVVAAEATTAVDGGAVTAVAGERETQAAAGDPPLGSGEATAVTMTDGAAGRDEAADAGDAGVPDEGAADAGPETAGDDAPQTTGA